VTLAFEPVADLFTTDDIGGWDELNETVFGPDGAFTSALVAAQGSVSTDARRRSPGPPRPARQDGVGGRHPERPRALGTARDGAALGLVVALPTVR
jgi:hypothetical protein